MKPSSLSLLRQKFLWTWRNEASVASNFGNSCSFVSSMEGLCFAISPSSLRVDAEEVQGSTKGLDLYERRGNKT